jgi:hypothetical protein
MLRAFDPTHGRAAHACRLRYLLLGCLRVLRDGLDYFPPLFSRQPLVALGLAAGRQFDARAFRPPPHSGGMNMADASSTQKADPILVAEIVRSYVAKNSIAVDEIGPLIMTVHRTLAVSAAASRSLPRNRRRRRCG